MNYISVMNKQLDRIKAELDSDWSGLIDSPVAAETMKDLVEAHMDLNQAMVKIKNAKMRLHPPPQRVVGVPLMDDAFRAPNTRPWTPGTTPNTRPYQSPGTTTSPYGDSINTNSSSTAPGYDTNAQNYYAGSGSTRSDFITLQPAPQQSRQPTQRRRSLSDAPPGPDSNER